MEKDKDKYYQFGGAVSGIGNYNFAQFNPYYRPNPAFQTGLAFGVDASPAAKIGTTSDLVFQSLFNLSNKLQPFFQDSKLYKNQDQLRSEQTRGSQRVEQAQSGSGYKNGGQIMYQNGPPFTDVLDKNIAALAPNEIQLEPSDTGMQAQLDYFLQANPPQPQTDFVPFQIQDPNLNTINTLPPVRQEPSRAMAEATTNKAANIIGATAAVGSFGMDLAKGIAGGIGVGRRSAYAYDRAQEKMREATINQGFEKGREDLFNQGYLQTTGFLAQNGGQTPIVVTDPNDPRLQAYNDSLNLYNKHTKAAYDVLSKDKDFIATGERISLERLTKDYPRITIPWENYRIYEKNETYPKHLSGRYSSPEYILSKNKIKPAYFDKFTSLSDTDIENNYFPHFQKPNQPVIYKPRPKQEPTKNVSVVDPKLKSTNLPDKIEGINTNIPNMFDNTYIANGAYLPGSGINSVIRKKGTHEIVAWVKGDPASGINKYYPPDTDIRKRLEFQNGGTQPIVVTDPNDPRLQAYNDSLALHNYSQLQHKLEPNTLDWYNPFTSKETDKKLSEGQFELQKEAQNNVLANNNMFWMDNRYAGTGSIFPKGSTKNTNVKSGHIMDIYFPEIWGEEAVPYFVESNSPDIGHINIKPTGTWWGKGLNFDYQKPTQPVVYQKPVVSDDKPQTPFPNQPTGVGMYRSISKDTPRPKQEPIKNVTTVDPKLKSTNLPDKVENVNTNMPNMFDNTYIATGYQPGSGINGVIRKKGTHERVAYVKDGKYYPPDTDTRKRLEFQNGGTQPIITPEQEVKFQEWYSQYAGLTGGTPNPDDPTLNMDFRSKWLETGGKLPNGEVIFQSGGAIPVSMNGLKEYPKQPVIVPSNNITMKGINYDVLAFPNNDQPVLMKPDQNYQFPNSTQVLEKPMMQDGGSMDKLAADSRMLTTKNAELPWVKRVLSNDSKFIQQPDGSKSTHKLAWAEADGKVYVYPTIVEDGKGLKQLEDSEAFDYAMSNKTAMEVPNKELAQYYSENGLIKHKNGGMVKLEDGLYYDSTTQEFIQD